MKRLGGVLVLLLAVASASAADPFQHIPVLLQDSSTSPRTPKDYLYFEKLSAEAEAFMDQLGDKTPRFGSIVFAVRQDASRRMWLDLYPALAPELTRALLSRLEAVPPCEVVGGTFVAAINLTIWHSRDLAFEPGPREWREAKERLGELEVTKLVDLIWPSVATPNTSLERTRER